MIHDCEQCGNRRHIPDPHHSGQYIRCGCVQERAESQLQQRANIPNPMRFVSWVDVKSLLQRKDYNRLSKYAGRMVPQAGMPKKPLRVEWIRGGNEDHVLMVAWLMLMDAIQCQPDYATAYYIDLPQLIDLQFDRESRKPVIDICETVAMLALYASNPKNHQYGGPILHDLVRKRIRAGLPTIVASRDLLDQQYARYGHDVTAYFKTNANKTELKSDAK